MKKNENILVINILLIFAVFLSITGFFTDVSNTTKYGGVDLRNRVVGARLLTQKMNPYHYKWKEGDSELLLDPRDNPHWTVNRVTVPPTILLLHSTISWLNYQIQRYFWLFFQWILLIASLYLFSKSSSSNIKSKLIWICGLFFFGSTFFWRLHIERGQIYIFYVFLIALAYWIYCKKKNNNVFWSGFVTGILIIFRPTAIVLGIPMIIFKEIKFIIGNIIGFISGFGFTLLFISPSVWQKYYEAMQTHGIIHFNMQYDSLIRYPYQNIEGITNLWILADIPIFDTSIQYLLRSIGIFLTSNILFIFFMFFIIIYSLIIRKIISNSLRFDSIFAAGLLLLFVFDFFLPAARYSYNNIMLLPFFMILINDSEHFMKLFKLNKNE